jgi:hypothetical protein
VASRYDESSVQTELSWTHHERLASRDDRLEWLAKAAAGKWSVKRLREELALAEELCNLTDGELLDEGIKTVAFLMRNGFSLYDTAETSFGSEVDEAAWRLGDIAQEFHYFRDWRLVDLAGLIGCGLNELFDMCRVSTAFPRDRERMQRALSAAATRHGKDDLEEWPKYILRTYVKMGWMPRRELVELGIEPS